MIKVMKQKRLSLRRIYIISTIVFLSSFKLWALSYNISDLEALERDKSYQEFFDHANDIRPSQRDKHWQSMVTSMGTGLVQNLSTKQEYKLKNYTLLEKISSWPSLLKNEFYNKLRTEYLVEFLENCYLSLTKINCSELIKSSWKYTPEKNKFLDFGIKLAQVISRHRPKESVWMYIKKPIKTELAHFYCKKGEIKKAIFKNIKATLQNKRDKNLNVSLLIDNMMSKDCWAQVAHELKGLLYRPGHVSAQIAYDILSAKNSLTRKEKDTYLVHFILKGPIVGETFNNAWHVLSELGQNYSRRRPIIDTLKQFDPLPDNVFTQYDSKKKKLLTQLLNNNLPEYIDHYSKTCINYLKGNGHFPNGNPTVSCSSFFNIVKDLKTNSTFVKSYSKIKKIKD